MAQMTKSDEGYANVVVWRDERRDVRPIMWINTQYETVSLDAGVEPLPGMGGANWNNSRTIAKDSPAYALVIEARRVLDVRETVEAAAPAVHDETEISISPAVSTRPCPDCGTYCYGDCRG